ncbi:MAG: bifunctional riboflavin kinase/FAD synthetase [Rhizobiales bacterium]|nr:bifunctional riboflavin kinase/FAD synthetase [Hyphomicrobiales bacterium]
MLLLENPLTLPENLRGGVVAIGNFDGVHRGHQRLLSEARQRASEAGKPWGVVTFEPHPRSHFKPGEPVFRLTPLPMKARLIGALGASYAEVIPFNKELASLEAEDFVRLHLAERLGVSHVVTGYDFHFGRGRRGNSEIMRQLGQKLGFGVSAVEQVTDGRNGGAPFASSSIRSALRRGHVPQANHELGYMWTIMGAVVEGDKRGRQIGFPTINIVLEKGAEPYRGIYAVRVRYADRPKDPIWRGAGYFGDRPTFETNRSFLEVFLLDFDGDLYGRTMMVEFARLIRPDRRFASVGELTAQMRDDCGQAAAILGENERANPLLGFELGRLQQDGKV